MPLRLPESGYRTMAPARGSTGDGQDRSARRTHQGLTRPARSLTPASGTTRSRPRHCGSSPRPSARSDPARASQPDDHAEPAGPARRAECQDLDGQGPGRPTAGARPERRDCARLSERWTTTRQSWFDLIESRPSRIFMHHQTWGECLLLPHIGRHLGGSDRGSRQSGCQREPGQDVCTPW
jgi:hypothetical protein